MSKLNRTFRQSRQSSLKDIAYVESIIRGKATVRLGTLQGKRIVNLDIIGGVVLPGSKVVVDWGANTPVVYPAELPSSSVFRTQQVVEPIEKTLISSAIDTSFCIHGTQIQEFERNVEQDINFSFSTFDTQNFFNPYIPNIITIPAHGYYSFFGHLSVRGFEDHRDLIVYAGWRVDSPYALWNYSYKEQFYLKLISDRQGVLGINRGTSMDAEPFEPPVIEVRALFFGEEGEQIRMVFVHESPTPEFLFNVIGPDGIYPRLAGFRMNQTTEGFVTTTPPPPGPPDSKIVILDNHGHLYLSNTTDSFARTIAQVENASNYELALDYKLGDIVYGAVLRFFLRASRDWLLLDTPTTGYEISINNTGGIALTKIETGARTLLTSINSNPSVLWFRLKFRTNGSQIAFKTWLKTDPEPDWQIDVTDPSPLPSGTMQLGLFRITGIHYVDIDNLTLSVL